MSGAYHYAEITIKKQVHPVFSDLTGAEDTCENICNIPFPPTDHISSIEPALTNSQAKTLMRSGSITK
jgi:hypothetical protein